MMRIQIRRQGIRDDAVVIAQELLEATAAVSQMPDMAVDLDAVTGGENDALAPFGIVGKLFEWVLKGIGGKMQALPPFDGGGSVVQTDDDDMHRGSTILLRGTGRSRLACWPHLP